MSPQSHSVRPWLGPLTGPAELMIEELKRYVAFTDADAQCLREARAEMQPFFDGIVDRFYDAIGANPAARSVFRDQAQIDRQKAFLSGWLDSLFRGEYDEAFREAHSRIGHAHVRVGLPERYMFGAMSVVRTQLHESVRTQDWTDDRKHRVRIAIAKLLDMDLAIMMDAYCQDRFTEVQQGERQAASQVITAVTRLTASLAHEVRNPLNAAQLQLELLKRDVAKLSEEGLAEQMTTRTNTVRNEIDRLGALLEDYLHLARPDQQTGTQEFDVVQLIDETLDLQKLAAAEVGAELTRLGADGPAIARGDRRRIKQVLVNLIRNALEAFAERDGGVVEVTAQLDNGMVRVTTCDNGPGLCEQGQQQAFDPFFTTKEGGTGLGLSIVQRIVMAHGGEVELVNNPAGGACARFSIPAAVHAED